MLIDIATIVLGAVSAVLVGFVSRRILGTPVGWPRSIVVGVIVFLIGWPFAGWVVDQTGLESAMAKGGRVGTQAALVTIAVVIVSIGWIFAGGVATLVALEAIFPTHPLRNPVDVVRAAVKQRRRTRRYLQIVSIASSHGAGWLFHGGSRADSELSTSQQRADAIVETINASGVTFVKLGQVLSTRRDLIPEPYLSALASLQSAASTLPWERLLPVVEGDIGGPLASVFRSVDEQPLAAASVAQVHRAVLNDGTAVVLKVQRPDASAQVQADVDIVLRLADRAEVASPLAHDLRVAALARGFTTTLLEELDYRVERLNTEMIRAAVANVDHLDGGARSGQPGGGPSAAEGSPIAVPRIHAAASGRRVLTMDLVEGKPLSGAAAELGQLTHEQRTALATVLMRAVLEQILVHGVFHADLHPGNVILQPGGTLALIDFGAVGIIERSRRGHLTALLLAAMSEDDTGATDALLQIVDVPEGFEVDEFRHEVGVVLTTQKFRPPGDGSIFTRMLDVIRRHRIALPADLASAFRSFATLEGCLRVIEPDFDLVENALPMVPSLLRKTVHLRQLATATQARAMVTAGILHELPRRLDTLLTGVERGTFGVRLRTLDDAETQGFIQKITSEVVGTLVSIAAVVIAVVLIVSDVGPVLAGGLRLLDLIGVVIGLFGFLGLLRVVRQIFVRRSP